MGGRDEGIEARRNRRTEGEIRFSKDNGERQAGGVEQAVPVVSEIIEALESVEADCAFLADVDQVFGFADGWETAC